MKPAQDITQSQKIYNCVDELLMEDIDYQFQLDQKQQQLQNLSTFKRVGTRLLTNATIKSSLRANKTLISPARKTNASKKITTKNIRQPTFIKNTKKSQSTNKAKFPNHKINILNVKGNNTLSENDLPANDSLKLKRTVSYDPKFLQQIKENDLELDVQAEIDNSFIETREGSPAGLLSPKNKNDNRDDWMKGSSSMFDSIKSSNTQKAKGKKLSNFSKQLSQSISRFSYSPPVSPKGITLPQSPNNSFPLTHDELQFLSLLYPNETPEQLMIKLLSYYEQQIQYKNSFEEITYKEEEKKKNYFFKSSADLSRPKEDHVREDDDSVESGNGFVKLHVDKCVDKEGKEETLNDYTRLKEQCLAALGSQMVQTHIKSSIVQTANVNYYTRQYAMPLIMELIEEKNQKAERKLEQLQEGGIQYQLGMSSTQPMDSRLLPPVYTSSSLPDEYIHKVYVPVNSRGQCFEMDYDPGGRLFEYVSENEYRRILRDVNHLIQKVLLHHRHNSFLKKKNNSLLEGWNLVLVVLLVSLVCLLFAESLFAFQPQSSYIEIMTFFSLSFLLILILGNAFNNYKKGIKRSSLIKDVCQEITNYLQFANCSSKHVKWVLGKDFFWLEVWVYLKRGGAALDRVG